MNDQSVYYHTNITELFQKNLYTFYHKEYKQKKINIINKINLYLDINNLLDTIIHNIINGTT